jgi:translation initiation factor 4G
MVVCKEKPASLPPLDAIGIEPLDTSSLHLMRSGSGRHRTSSTALPPARQASIGLGFSSTTMGKGASTPYNLMGNFATGGSSKLTSEDRFAASSRAASVSGVAGMQFETNKLTNTIQNMIVTSGFHNPQPGFEPVVPLRTVGTGEPSKLMQTPQRW